MATIIKIKRTTGSSAPSGLAQGELAYVYDTSAASTGAGGNGLRLFIGDHTSTSNAAIEIGGQYYKLLLDHAHGTLTASSALIVDSNKAIDELLIGNSATVGGTIKFNEGTNNGTHFVALKSPNSVASSLTFTLPGTDGSSGHILTTDGSGNLSFAAPASSQFTIAADSGSDDTFNTGETLTLAGGTGIDSTVSNNQVSFAIDATVATLAGTQTFTNKTLTSPKLNENVALSATSTELNLLDGITAINDEDDMSSDSNTSLATQQSIKAYVDSQVTAQDLDLTTDSGTIAIDLDSETLTIAGGTGLTSSASGNTATLAIDSTVTTLTGSQTLTNKTLTSPVFTTPQINDSSADHQYVIAVSELTADRTVTLPLLTGNDQVTMDAHTSTLTNKTIDLASNTVTGSLSEFNTALQSESFVGLAATQTLTNKTLTSPTITGTGAIAGTFTGDITGNVTGNTSGSSGSCTGNAATATLAADATTLATARTIAGKSFDGSANITIAATDLSDTDQALAQASNVQFANLTLSGNLTVNGTTTTVATTNTTISDNLLELNSGAGSNANDSGILIERGSTGDNAIIAWDESADKFVVGTTTATNDATGNLTIATGTLVANVEGAVTGNASTATALANARTIAGQSFDGTGNITIASTDLSNTSAIALLTASQTLTNKTIAAGSNTISGITSSHFASAVTLVINDSSGSAVKTIVGSAS
jgi:hypothetical protein